jgi:1,4-alpha-glucan branching enzyme
MSDDTTVTKARRIKFEIEAEKGSDVYVAGTFNEWDTTKKKLVFKNGTYSGTLSLAPGRYEYKFMIDGIWCVDPKCREWAPNQFGSLNSVLIVE